MTRDLALTILKNQVKTCYVNFFIKNQNIDGKMNKFGKL
jgi:hypothetical protein